MNKNDGGPAFPHMMAEGHKDYASGISLRDYFAAAALQGMLAYSHVNPMRGNYHENCSISGAAVTAYEYADAMLKAREAK